MKRSLAISLLLHGVLVAVLIGAPITRTPPRPDRAVSLVTVEVVSHPEAPEPAEVVVPVPDKRERPHRVVQDGPAGSRSTQGRAAEPGGGRKAGPEAENAQGPVQAPSTPAVASGIGDDPGTMIVVVAVPGQGGVDAAVQAASARAGGGTGAGKDFTADYKTIRDAIDRVARRSYPLQARKLGLKGVVTVRFTVGPDGGALDVVVVAGSGYDLLDDAARAIVSKAGPYPAVPEPVKIPIRFSLETTK